MKMTKNTIVRKVVGGVDSLSECLISVPTRIRTNKSMGPDRALVYSQPIVLLYPPFHMESISFYSECISLILYLGNLFISW